MPIGPGLGQHIDPIARDIDRRQTKADDPMSEAAAFALEQGVAAPAARRAQRDGDDFVKLYLADEKETRRLLDECADHMRANCGMRVADSLRSAVS